MRSVQNSEKTAHQGLRKKKMALQPSPELDNQSIIKAKVQPHYVLKDKDRPDESDDLLGFSFGEAGSELKYKSSKKVRITEMDGYNPPEVGEERTTPVHVGFSRSGNGEEEDNPLTSGIQTYFEAFNDQEPLMNEMAQDFLTEMAMLGSEYDLRKILGIPKPPEKPKPHIDIAKDAKLKQITYLSALETTAVIAVLDKAIDELSIIKHLLPASSEKVDTRYKPMNVRLGKRLSRSEWKEFEIPKEDPHPAEQCLKKIQNDREFVQTTLWMTARSLLRNNNFSPIKNAVEEQRAMMTEEVIMAWKWPVTNIRMEQARKILLESKKALAIMPVQHSVHMQEMQEGMSHTMLTLEARKRYVERWEAARRFQHNFKLSRDEDALRKKISELGALTVDELRVGDEITRYMGLEDRRLRAMLAAWEERHEKEIEHVTVAILNSNLTLEVAQYHTQSVQKEYDGRVAELLAWKALQESNTKEVEATLRLQKWWRHVLYRRRVAAALSVIKRARIEFAKFAKKIIEQAEALALIEPPPPETEDEKRLRERQERLAKKKKDGPSPEELIKMALRKLNVADRLALSRKVLQRRRYMMTKVLAALQALLGDVEARKILEAEERLQIELAERRRRRREILKAAGKPGVTREDESSELSYSSTDISEDMARLKRPMAKRMTRPHIPGISPRFSTPLTDRLARASLAAKRRKRYGGPGSLLKTLQKKYLIEDREIRETPGGRLSQVAAITEKLKKIEERKAKEAAKEAKRRAKLGLTI